MRAAAAMIALLLGTGEARACALELILAIDVSGSVNSREFALQMDGIASALTDPKVIEAVEGLEGGIVATATQWSGSSRQATLTGWHHATDAAGLAGLAQALRGAPRAWRNFSTAIGEALTHALGVSRSAPLACRRRVIDVSGDGVSNEGISPGAVAAGLAAAGYTVNGLVIRGADPDPVAYYEAEVIAGPGAFVETASSFEDYGRAMRRKLLREIEQPLFLSRDAPRPGRRPGFPLR